MTDSSRILWLTPDKPENISVGRSRIARQLRALGHEVTVRGTNRSTLAESLRERGAYDIVLGTTRAGAIGGMILSFVHRLPLVVDHIDPIAQFRETHPSWLSIPVATAERLAFARSSITLFVYESERERVEKYAPRAMKTALGVDVDRFEHPDQDVLNGGRELLPSNLEHPVGIYVGGLEPIYNVEGMLEAGSSLETGSLVIAGAGSLAELVEERAERAERIHYLGSIPHETVPGVLAACDVGLSLVDDPHTLKVLEYGAAGLPVIQLDGLARERFADRVTYTTTDPSAIREAFLSAADGDASALQSFVREFDWQNIAQTYAEAIEAAQ